MRENTSRAAALAATSRTPRRGSLMDYPRRHQKYHIEDSLRLYVSLVNGVAIFVIFLAEGSGELRSGRAAAQMKMTRKRPWALAGALNLELTVMSFCNFASAIRGDAAARGVP